MGTKKYLIAFLRWGRTNRTWVSLIKGRGGRTSMRVDGGPIRVTLLTLRG